MKKKTKEKVNIGEECGRDDFKSEAGLRQHKSKSHPYIPPPPPKKTVEVAPNDLEESFNLIGGHNLEVGDVFYHHKKLVILKIIKTEGSNTVEVVAKVTQRHWDKNS